MENVILSWTFKKWRWWSMIYVNISKVENSSMQW